MREIIARGAPFVRQVMDRDEAIAFFQAKGEKYKAQLIQDLPATETITLYARATGSICAAARTCAPPPMSAPRSS